MYRSCSAVPADSRRGWLSPVTLSLLVAGLIIGRSMVGMVWERVSGVDVGAGLGEVLRGIPVPLRERAVAAKVFDLVANAEAAGVSFVDEEGSVERTMSRMLEGKWVTEGALEGSFFQLRLLEGERDLLEERLEIRGGRLSWRPDGE